MDAVILITCLVVFFVRLGYAWYRHDVKNHNDGWWNRV